VAQLPYARVRFFPDPAEVVGDLGQAVSVIAVESAGEVGEPGGGGEDLAVDIQLRLPGRTVADAGRARAAVAGERQRFLLRFGTAVEAVEDLEAWVGQLRGVEQPKKEGACLGGTAERK